jgi:hypothetical protein
MRLPRLCVNINILSFITKLEKTIIVNIYMSDVNAFEDFDFSELFDLDFREKNLIFELEKKRIQKLVEASDIEMTELLFNGVLDREKKTEIVSINKKKEPCKKVERKTEVLPNKNKSIKFERRKKDFKDVFGESEFIDPYELEYGNIFSSR